MTVSHCKLLFNQHIQHYLVTQDEVKAQILHIYLPAIVCKGLKTFLNHLLYTSGAEV